MNNTFNTIASEHAVHALVNNVGIALPECLGNITLESLDRVYDLNVRTAVQAAQCFIATMKQQRWGRIVNIASRAILGKVGRSGFAAAKAALVALTRTWALELAKEGITVNAIAPDPVNTEQFFLNHPKGSEQERRIISGIPMGRVGEPDEVAYAVEFFLNEQAGFITGQTLFINGGGSL